MKIAFASKNGKHIDYHFGQCQSFSIFELDKQSFKWLETRLVHDSDAETDHNGRVERRLNAVRDCNLLFVSSIGTDASKRAVKAGIMILKVESEAEVIPQLEKLQLLLAEEHPPLWLTKALLRSDKEDKRC